MNWADIKIKHFSFVISTKSHPCQTRTVVWPGRHVIKVAIPTCQARGCSVTKFPLRTEHWAEEWYDGITYSTRGGMSSGQCGSNLSRGTKSTDWSYSLFSSVPQPDTGIASRLGHDRFLAFPHRAGTRGIQFETKSCVQLYQRCKGWVILFKTK
jgi:hypothetical protein